MFTLKTLCKALVITAFSLNLSSCSNDDETDFINYKLQTVKWKLDINDTEKINVIELPPTVDLNQTDESIHATFTVADKIEETSQFFCDNPELFDALISQDTIPGYVFQMTRATLVHNTKDYLHLQKLHLISI